MNTSSRGFTVIEIIIVIAILSFASVIFFVQKNNIEVAARDEQRKTAINAMYYGLEEVYFTQNGHYPRTINDEILPSVAPELFKDVEGTAIGESGSEYRYEATNCTDTVCKNYTLRTILENEDDYVKKNR
jgi:prepilin-type N-terminal cleavage/methylation domain-containing protein